MKKLIFAACSIAICGLGFAGGIIFERDRFKSKTKFCGTLRMDNSEQDESTNLFLELTPEGWRSLEKTDTAIFKVIRKNYITQ